MQPPEVVNCYKTAETVWAGEYPVTVRDKPFRLRDVIVQNIKQTLQAMWQLSSIKSIRDYYCGLGSCLLYHRIASSQNYIDEWSPYRGLSVTSERFEEQMRYIKENYNCLPLPEAIALLSERRLPPKTVVVTFDDGYRDNLTLALPILEKYDIPATIYVTTGLVNRSEQLWWFEQEFLVRAMSRLSFEWNGTQYEWTFKGHEERFHALQVLNRLFKGLRPDQQRSLMDTVRSQSTAAYSYDDEILNWDEIIQLDKHPLITIGAHTTSHPMLSLLGKKQLYQEINESKLQLEAVLEHPVEHLAYPFGGRQEIGKTEFQAAEDCNFVSAVTTRHGHLYEQHNRHLHVLPRIAINSDDHMESFAWKLSGIYCLIQQYGQRMIVS